MSQMDEPWSTHEWVMSHTATHCNPLQHTATHREGWCLRWMSHEALTNVSYLRWKSHASDQWVTFQLNTLFMCSCETWLKWMSYSYIFKSDLLRPRSQMNKSWSAHERVMSQMKESRFRYMSHVSQECMINESRFKRMSYSCIHLRRDSLIWGMTLSSEIWHVRGCFMTHSSETAGGGDRT